jgi:hypothetical protein
MGQTGHTFNIRYNDHVSAIKSNKSTSRSAEHVLDNRHFYGTVHDTVEIVLMTKEGNT